MLRTSLFLACLLIAVPTASAQRLLAHDTLSTDTPSVVSCGFCGGEVIGVVFRELPGTAGIRDTDFPMGLTNVQIALAAASTDGATCTSLMVGGVVDAAVEIWAGITPPETLPGEDVTFGMAWPDETLLWASDAVPLTLSTATVDGDSRFDLQFNAYMLRDESDEPIIVPLGNSYLRVAVQLPGGGEHNSVCADPVEVPSGFPLRDNDGVLQPLRSHIYGNGIGWRWNETVGLGGDWAIRVEVAPMPGPRDAGMRDGGGADAGSDTGSASDTGIDAGTSPPDDTGCGCRLGARTSSPVLWFAAFALVIASRHRAARR
jgi:hypothetical protein